MKLTKTDHYEQALVIDKQTNMIIREAFGAMLDNQVGTIEMRDQVMQLKQMLEDPNREDRPAIFQKTHGIMITCPDCAGTRTVKIFPEDNNDEIEFAHCQTCKGEGQLYHEVIRKSYVPTDFHRRKLAK